MSFITERYFQILENHKLYERVIDEQSLHLFMEHHVICVWSYNYLLRDIHQELVALIHPLNSQSQKEAIRLASEMMLDAEAEEQVDGSFLSHFEIYLEAMQDLGANISPIVSFFDLQDSGQNWQTALKHARFPAAVSRYARRMSRFTQAPLHERAAALFYEGEPFIPDSFLLRLGQMGNTVKVGRLLDYFERHIEGIKRPGYSAMGRLVEILCSNDEQMSREAEDAAAEAMKNRMELWNHLTEQLDLLPAPIKVQRPATSLRLVTSGVI